MKSSLRKLFAVVGLTGGVLVASGLVLGGHDRELAAKAEPSSDDAKVDDALAHAQEGEGLSAAESGEKPAAKPAKASKKAKKAAQKRAKRAAKKAKKRQAKAKRAAKAKKKHASKAKKKHLAKRKKPASKAKIDNTKIDSANDSNEMKDQESSISSSFSDGSFQDSMAPTDAASDTVDAEL